MEGHYPARLSRHFRRSRTGQRGGRRILRTACSVSGDRGPGVDLRAVRRPRQHRTAPRFGVRHPAVRRRRCDPSPAEPAGCAAARRPRRQLHCWPDNLFMERQWRHQGAVRRAERRLRGKGKAELRPAQCDQPGLHGGMIMFLIFALACIVALPAALNYLPGFVGQVLNYARWPALLVIVALALGCIYRYGPSRAESRWRWISWGSAFAALAWLGFSAIFSYYAANFANFNKTYGSLGAIIGFMMWMWLSGAVILVGAELKRQVDDPT